ncbi:MAG: copper-binding protein [Pseudomonadota bacterium]|nr:copper-binding protein [Pseudomonadota bacterium]
MKSVLNLSLMAALLISSSAFGQSDAMKGMKGMEKEALTPSAAGPHTATAVVKAVDVGHGKVTLAHGPIKSLGWPAMTMAFAVKDKSLLDKLAVGKTVHVELQKENSDYVVTAVK